MATIDLVGSYVTSNFHLAAGNGGSGTIITDPQATIAGGSVLAISMPASSKVTFAGSNATLMLDQPPIFSGTVPGFGAKDHIDLPEHRLRRTHHARLH